MEKVTRPWGTYQVLSQHKQYQVKEIVVFPGQRLSLQRHQHRAEHWVIIQGTGIVTVGENNISVQAESTVFIDKMVTHRIANTGDRELRFIEVQTGTYFGEDDIERLEDDYGRVSS